MANIRENKNFTAVEIGQLEQLDQPEKAPIPGKYFLKDLLKLTSMEVSVNKLPAGKQSPFLHSHIRNEELFIFIKGSGQFQVDGETFDIQEGSMIRVGPEGVRALRSSQTEDLYYICVQADENSLKQFGLKDANRPDTPLVWPE